MCHTYEIRYIYVRTSYAEHTHVIRMKYTCVIHMTYGVHKSIRDSYDRTFVIRMKCVIQMLTRHTQDIHTSYIWNIHVSYVWHTYDVPTCRGCIAVQCPLWHMYKCVPSYICTSVFPPTHVWRMKYAWCVSIAFLRTPWYYRTHSYIALQWLCCSAVSPLTYV